MDFRCEHLIPAPLARVEQALLDPATLRLLPRYAPVIADVLELERHDTGEAVERVARYRAAFVPPPLAPFISLRMTTWTERVRWSRAAHAGAFTIEPSLSPALLRRFACAGTYRLQACGPAATARVVEGSLRVDAPLVGPFIERTIAGVIERQLAGEAALLGERA